MDNRGLSSNWGKEHGDSELRLVLLGGRCSGKSWAGNAVLGKAEFPTGRRTARCVVGRRGEVGARRVAVVDTPGWWCDFFARDTPELVKREIVGRGAALCAPGPHAFLLAVKASSPFTEKRRRAVEEHLELFGRRVWQHTLVLFTHGDRLGETTVHRHIENEGKALQWLVEKCGNRYHELNDESPATGAQVTELLAKVEQMVAGNGCRHYEIDGEAFKEVEDRREAVRGGVEQRLADMQKQSSLLTGAVPCLPEPRIVLLGARRSGKSRAGNCILGRSEFLVGVRTASCAVGRGLASGRRVVAIDTPGWWMNYSAEESPEYDRQEVRRSPGLCPPGPHVVVAVVRADRSFGETHRRALAGHLELLGEAVWRHVLVLFTFGDWLGDGTVEEHVEAEGGALRWLVEKCGNKYHVLGSETGGDDAQVTQLLEKIDEMVAGNGGLHYGPGETFAEVEERRTAAEERAKERMRKVREERRAIRSLPGRIPPLSDLTIVLLGSTGVGKSSSGNTILGRDEFEAGQKTECWQKRLGEMCGRSVTVVDTPGWSTVSSGYAEVGEREVLPRPNALLLAVNASSSFTEAQRRAAEEGLELQGEGAWDRALVLFTNGDWLGDTTIERRVESEGSTLRWLVDRCENRYHVLDNKSRGDRAQVAELLDKIEEMEATRQQRKAEVEIITELHEQHLGEELDKNPPTAVCSFSSHHQCLTKRDSSGMTLEKHESLKFHILPLLSLVLQSTSRAGKSHEETSMPGRKQVESQAHEPEGPSLLIDRDLREEAGPWFVKADFLYPTSSSYLQNLLLVMLGEQLKVRSCRSMERPGAILDKTLADHAVILLTQSEMLDESIAEEPVQSGQGNTPEELSGESTIEELESFIDAYFETVMEGAVETPAPMETRHSIGSMQPSSSQPPTRDEDGQLEPGHWSLSLMDQKLAKLNILEAIQKCLREMNQTLQLSCQIIQEIRENGDEDQPSTKLINSREPG